MKTNGRGLPFAAGLFIFGLAIAVSQQVFPQDGAEAGTPGETAGTPGKTAGTLGETAGTPGKTAGTPGETAGSPGETAGTPGETAGSPGETAGSPGETAGSLGETAGTLGETAGSPGKTAGSPGETAGLAEDGFPDLPDDNFLDFGADREGVTLLETPETTQQMEVITRDEIERRNAQDLATLLEDALDMSVTRYGGYGNQTELSLRGFDTERIAILVDGVPANSPRSGEFDVSQVNINDVERIEVIYGGSDTKYNVSGALGGVINIITIKKQKPGLSLSGAFSNTGYLPGRYNMRHSGGKIGGPHAEDIVDMQSLSFSGGYGAERFSLKGSIFGNRAGNHYLYEDDYSFARRKVSNEVLDAGGAATAAWNLSDTTTILSDTKMYIAGRNFPVTPNSTGYAEARDFQITENILFNAPVIFRDDLGTEASISYQYSNTSYGVDTRSFDNYITVINRWNWYPVEKLTLRAGLDWRFLHIDSRSATETDPVKTGNMGGLYLTGEYLPVNVFMIIASVKGVTDTRQNAAVPKLGFRWEITPLVTLKNNYFRSFKFPDFDDLYYRSLDSVFVGNPDLRPEDGVGADLTGEFKLSDMFALDAPVFGVDATAYVQWTEDSIHWVKSAGGRWSPENIGTAFFIGADLRPSVTLEIGRGGIDSLKLGASYQFQLSWLLSGNLSFSNSYRIPYMPTHIIGFQADLGWKTGSLLVSAHYETTRYADTLNQMPLAPHCTVHATVNQDIGKYFTVFGSLRNILNAHYESFAGYYMPGISLTLGVKAAIAASAKRLP
ncbi:MAG: TonB-dependent receptor [Spirochaetaceae bacterium]|nr:TonB-dependent receptor [Spirochaetaceae bacterium]